MRPNDDSDLPVNAEYSVEADGSYLALILESSGGRTATGIARNADYQLALFHLLSRLKRRDATLVNAVVDSRIVRDLPESQRALVVEPIRLARHSVEVLQQRLTSGQGRIGQRTGAPKAGNQRKRIRLRLTVPGYEPRDADRLAHDLARSAVGDPVRTPQTSGERATSRVAPSEGGVTPVADPAGIDPASPVPAPARKGGGTGQAGRIADAVLKTAIQYHAETWAADFYSAQGYTVQNVGDVESYDLEAVRGNEEIHVEVKGSSGMVDRVNVTANEVTHAHSRATHLVVLDDIQWTRRPDGTVATSGGRARRWSSWAPAPEDLVPTEYRYRLPADPEDR